MARPPAAQEANFHLRIQLLGEFAVWFGNEKIPEERWHLRRARSLIKLLALAAGHRMHRDQIADTLWPESDPDASTNNFHQTLYAARRVLEPYGSACLRLEEGFLSLTDAKGQPAWVDVDQFEAAATAARGSHDPAAYQAALELYPGELLPEDIYDEWILPRRDALRRRYISLLFEQAQAQEMRQEYPPAIDTLGRLLSADPANEEAHVALMRLYALSGKRGQALRQYQTLREVLWKDLETEPGAAATRLYEDIQANRFPPAGVSTLDVSSPQSPPHNLPVHLTSFIGREAQIAEVASLVTGHHLVTLTGAGGTGKTRLALQVAERVLAKFPQGVWLAELAPISDPDLVIRVVAESFGLLDLPGQDLRQTIMGFLQPRVLLLVLDNCEHVIAGAAALVAQLLHTCRGLHILATSREILGVEGEAPFRCPSLSLPDEKPAGLDHLAQSEAVRLFIERAQSVRPDFALSETNAAQVVQICRRLDGIPLAIELAAARARMLSVEQIAARLEHTFGLLSSSSRSALPRHQTLKALIDWSYNLLTLEERTLLLRLSVFAGSWTLEAAEHVCSDAGSRLPTAASAAVGVCGDPDEPSGATCLYAEQIVELLGQLIDKSLIQFEPSSNEEPRYRMLETIRQYAHERLAEQGEEAAARERHLDYYISLAEQAEPNLRAWEAKTWLDRLDQELDNLRLALDWALSGPLLKGLQLATPLWWFWWCRNHSLEGAERLDRLLAQEEFRDMGSLETATRVLLGRAMNVFYYLVHCGYNELTFPHHLVLSSERMAKQSLAVFQELGEAYQRDYAISCFIQGWDSLNKVLECHAMFQACNDRFWMSECDQCLNDKYFPTNEKALSACEEYLALKKEIGDQDGEALAWVQKAWLEFFKGNRAQAFETLFRAQAIFEAMGNRVYAAMTRDSLANLYIIEGNYQEALEQSELFLASAKDLHHEFLFGSYQYRRAWVAWARKEYDLAVRCCEETLEMRRDWPLKKKHLTFYLLGRVAISRGNLSQAKIYLKICLTAESFQIDPFVEVPFRALHALGVIAVAEGQAQRAAIVFGIHSALWGPNEWLLNILSPPERAESEQALEQARAILGEEAFRAAWETGCAMDEAQALAFVQECLA